MDRSLPNRLLVLRRLQRRDVGVRRFRPRHRPLIQGRAGDCRDGVFAG